VSLQSITFYLKMYLQCYEAKGSELHIWGITTSAV